MESLVVGKLNQELVDIKNYKGLKIPFRIIRAIGDIVLIRHLPGAFKSGNFDET
jgi:sporulation protein YlmC with PRC-barrel domain